MSEKTAPKIESNNPADPTTAGPGVGSLLRGKAEAKNVFAGPQTEAETPAVTPTPVQKPLIPRWYFFAGDVLLIAFVLAILFRNSGELDSSQAVICAVAIVVAAFLGVMGVCSGRKGE